MQGNKLMDFFSFVLSLEDQKFVDLCVRQRISVLNECLEAIEALKEKRIGSEKDYLEKYWNVKEYIEQKIKSFKALCEINLFLYQNEKIRERIARFKYRKIYKEHDLVEDFLEQKFFDKVERSYEEVQGRDATKLLMDQKYGFSVDGHIGEIMCLDVSFDCQYVATASADMTVKIWKYENFELVNTFHRHKNRLKSVLFRSDSYQVVSGSCDGYIYVWNIDGQVKFKIKYEADDKIISFDLTKNGDYLVISTQKYKLKAINLSNPDSKPQIIICPYLFSQIKAFNSGNWVLGLHQNNFYLFDLIRSATISYHICLIKCFCVSPEEKLLACGYNNKKVVVFICKNGFILTTLDHLHGLSSLNISKNNHYLISACLKYIVILDLSEESRVIIIPLKNFTIYSLKYLERKEIITGRDKGRLCKFLLNEKDKFESDIHSKKVIHYLTTKSKAILVTATKDEDVRIWNVLEKKLMKKIDFSPEICKTVSLTRSEKFVVVGFRNFFSLFRVS